MLDFISNLFHKTSSREVNTENKHNTGESSNTLFDDNTESGGINGEIDEAVYQGIYGDCWLLSGILSMSYTDAGAQVIKDSINLNPDGSVNIAFSGVDREYTVSSKELEKYNMDDMDEKSNYSTGDDDMLALELGIEAVVADESVKTNYSIQDGGNPYYIYKLFDAENIEIASSQTKIRNAFDYFEDNKESCSMTLGVVGKSVCGLKADHGYAIKDIDEKNVTLVDPWDSTEEIQVSRKELIKNYNNLSVVYAEFEDAA